MNNTITANLLKTKGISAVNPFAKKGIETIVTVRGEDKYVILTKNEFDRLREYELTAAILETEQDMKTGKYHTNIEKHLKEVTNA